MLKENTKATIYQIFTSMILVIIFIIIDQFMDDIDIGNPASSSKTLYLIGGLLFTIVTWIYLMLYFQTIKDPHFMDHKVWRIVPAIIFAVSIISFIAFLALVMGPLFDLLEQMKFILYPILLYSMTLAFFFIMSLVHKFSASKQNVLHHTYAWTLGMLFFAAFII